MIGGGWAARFLLNGHDVQIFDPDPDAPRKVEEVIANARRAYARLTLAPLPREGTLSFVASPEEAADGADLVQESAPERVELKRELLAAAARALGDDAVLCSSTSGLRPTLLQADLPHADRLTVAHPFNPVYLLPLVELCGGEETAPETIGRAAEIYRAVGMHPLHVRREIDGFLSDRLLEALWREALWLVHDDVATTSELDDAIRYGPGLRWAAMGTFLTYRIAGGEAGMRHFMAQFGPALQWPWTKLMDVPDLTDELVEKVAAQSDDQATGASVRELERTRDDCLVAILQALREQGLGAGATLGAWERALFAVEPEPIDDWSQPLPVLEARVPAEWIDYNGHVHESRYLQLFGDSADALFRQLGIDEAYLADGGSYFTVETHLSHLRVLETGDRAFVTTQVLGADEKRLHVFHVLRREGEDDAVATAEQLYVHVDTEAGRSAPVREPVRARVEQLAAAHAKLPRPERAGRSIRLG